MRARRFLQYSGVALILLGGLLLAGVAVYWAQAQRLPETLARPVRGPQLEGLPPALAPVAAESQPALSLEATAFAPSPVAGDSEAPALLPSSPLPQQETIRYGIETAAPPAAGPRRLIIPALGIDAPIEPAGLLPMDGEERTAYRWAVPDRYAAGWHETSGLPGQPGNIVLNGHNNVYGSIFGDLANLPVGEQIVLVSDEGPRLYRVAHHELLREAGMPLRERLKNARWIAPTADERLTLVTCWPNTTNSHRLIVVARPEGDTNG